MVKKSPGLIAILAGLGLVMKWLLDLVSATMVGEFITHRLAAAFGMDAAKMIATISEFALPVIIASLLIYVAFLMGVKERAANPSKLRIDFSDYLSGCRSETNFRDGEKATFYRLLVRPPEGQIRTGCTGTLVDIMAPFGGAKWVSVWSAQRLPLTWATHTQPSVTSIDLLDDHGRFLDVFFVTESGTVGVATPGLVQPFNLLTEKLWKGPCYLMFCISVSEPTGRAQEIHLAFKWTGDPQTSHAKLLSPFVPTNPLIAALQSLTRLSRQAKA